MGSRRGGWQASTDRQIGEAIAAVEANSGFVAQVRRTAGEYARLAGEERGLDAAATAEVGTAFVVGMITGMAQGFVASRQAAVEARAAGRN